MLVSGGDERVAIDPGTGRTRYGTPRGTTRDEVWFSSSTATAISPRGYDAALLAYRWAVQARDERAISVWFERIRARLNALFGIDGSEIVLSASGTELELIALLMAQSILRPPLTNVVMAPGETGSGVMLTASGRHFLSSSPFRSKVEHGAWVEGFESLQSRTEAVEIRDAAGMPRSPEAVDDDVVAAVAAAIAGGGSALIHLLDCSKTDRSGLRRPTASALSERFAGRALVVVDSCQLRCSPEQIRADLRAGFMVMITGSKFAGGPPFCGALLLPPGVVEQLPTLELPPGLLAHTAAEDWPLSLRGRIGGPFAARHNVGAGLRWEAALAGLERLFDFPPGLRQAVVGAFASAVRQRVRENPDLELIDDEDGYDALTQRTIFPDLTAGCETLPAAESIRRALRQPASRESPAQGSNRIFHVGQPVAIGNRVALRVCLSASEIVDALERMANGQAFEPAVAPLMEDIDSLFRKWARAVQDFRRGRFLEN